MIYVMFQSYDTRVLMNGNDLKNLILNYVKKQMSYHQL